MHQLAQQLDCSTSRDYGRTHKNQESILKGDLSTKLRIARTLIDSVRTAVLPICLIARSGKEYHQLTHMPTCFTTRQRQFLIMNVDGVSLLPHDLKMHEAAYLTFQVRGLLLSDASYNYSLTKYCYLSSLLPFQAGDSKVGEDVVLPTSGVILSCICRISHPNAQHLETSSSALSWMPVNPDSGACGGAQVAISKLLNIAFLFRRRPHNKLISTPSTSSVLAGP